MKNRYSNPGTMSARAVYNIEEQFTSLPGNKYLQFVTKIEENKRGNKITYQIVNELTNEVVGHACATIVDETKTVIEFSIY